MIQISIIHFEDGTSTVKRITEGGYVMSEFNAEEGKIDFTPLKDHIGEQIEINHFNANEEGDIEFDYSAIKVLMKVGMDKDGFQVISYE